MLNRERTNDKNATEKRASPINRRAKRSGSWQVRDSNLANCRLEKPYNNDFDRISARRSERNVKIARPRSQRRIAPSKVWRTILYSRSNLTRGGAKYFCFLSRFAPYPRRYSSQHRRTTFPESRSSTQKSRLLRTCELLDSRVRAGVNVKRTGSLVRLFS